MFELVSSSEFILRVFIFFLGVTVAFSSYVIRRKILSRRKMKQRIAEMEIEMEEKGWIKAKDFPLCHDRSEMEGLLRKMKKEQEIFQWVIDNTVGDFEMIRRNNNTYIRFKNEKDALGFKLWWTK